MQDRFNELLSNLEQQISRALAEARVTQTEPLERSREVESRFDMISPGEKPQDPFSITGLKPEGSGRPEGLDGTGDERNDSPDHVDGAALRKASGDAGPAEARVSSPHTGNALSEDPSTMEQAVGAQSSSSQPEVSIHGDGTSAEMAFIDATPVNTQSGDQSGDPEDQSGGREGPSSPEENAGDGSAPELPQPEAGLEAPDLATSDIVSDEDVRIDFSRFLQADTGGQDGTLSVTISGVPEGASFSAGVQTAPGIWTFTESQLKGLTFTPPANSDADFSLKVVATLTDAAGHLAVNTAQIDVQIDAVADQPVVSHESGPLSEIVLRVSSDYYQGDPNLKIDVDGQVIGTWRLTADHRVGNWQEIRIVGDFGPNGPQNIGVSFVNDHYSGTQITDRNIYVDWIEVNGKTYQSEGPGVTYTRASDTIPGQEGMHWNGRMSFDTSGNGGPSNGVAVGLEDNAVAVNLKAMLADTDGSETLSIRISGLPDGVQLSAGTYNADGSWSLSAAQLDGLTIVQPANFNGQFTLHVEATSTEAANADTATTRFDMPVHIAPVNDAPYGLTLTGSAVAENAAGAEIGRLHVSDIDSGDSLIYNVSDSRFEVVDGMLKLKAGVSLNYEAAPTINLKITATDTAGATATLNTTVQVSNVNEAPSTPSLSYSTVNENAAGATIGRITATDPDAGDTITYGVSDARFEIVGGYLKLKPGLSLNYENEPTVNLKITATDSGGLTSARDVTIAVKNVNEAPSTPNVTVSPVAENAAGAVVGHVTATDPDAGDSIRYTISDSRFEVVDGTIKLKDGVSLNYETTPSLNLKVTATDNGGLKSEKTFTVNVGNVNEAPSTPTLDASTVAEHAVGATIGKVAATDPDAGDTITYGVSDARFEIVGGYLKLKPGVSLDYENEPTVNLKITATDSGGLVSEKAVAITVTNVNEAPYNLGLNNSSVAENAAGAVVGKVSATDPDGNALTYTVSDNRFEVVDGDLKLKAGVSLDYETQPSLNLKVTATDPGGLRVEKTFAVNVTNVNEAPSQPALSASTVAENVAGAVIGHVTATDPDASDSLQYSVNDNRFEIVNGDLKLKAGISLNYETEPAVNVKVTATDAGGLSSEKTFTINVGDVNEAPDAPALNDNIVAENAAGAVVGHVAATDPDAGDSLQYSVNDSRFEIVNGDLKLKTGVSLNYEAEPTVTLKVTATDASGLASEKTFTVNVTNVNEAPSAPSLSASTATENAAGATIGRVTATDPDAGDSLQYSVNDNRFEIVNGDLKLKAGVLLNYEAEPTVNVKITATDTSGLTSEKAYAINVTNVNEAPSAPTLDNHTVAENAAGAVVGKIAAVDPDAGDTLQYSVSDSRFEVVNGDLKLKSGVSLNYETEQSVNVKVTASDAAGLSSEKTFTIGVGDVNEAPQATAIQGQFALRGEAFSVDVGDHFSDVDAGDSLTYSMNGPSWMHIDPATGAITGTPPSALTEPQMVNGVYQLTGGHTLVLDMTNFGGSAGNDNTIGIYYTDASGVPLGGVIVYESAKELSSFHSETLLSAYPAAKAMGFFIIANGNNLAHNYNEGDFLSFVKVGNGYKAAWGPSGEAADTFFSNSALNADGISHLTNNSAQGNFNWEDLYDGGDQDYDDVNFNASVKVYSDPPSAVKQVTVTATDENGLSVSKTFPVTIADERADTIQGTAYNDVISGGDSADTLRGGTGNDALNGGAGKDTIHGDGGADKLYGGAGDDQIYIDAQDTVVQGGDGYDKVVVTGTAGVMLDMAGSSIEYIEGGAGNDVFYASATSIATTQYGNGGNDALIGGTGNDIFYGGSGDDTISAGSGVDKAYLGDGNDIFDTVNGNRDETDGADTVYGEAGHDSIWGGGDIDLIYGGDGNDYVNGESGNDTIYGDAGTDSLFGDNGLDTIYGGAGDDVLYGGTDDDTLFGGSDADKLYGGAGADVLKGDAGRDILYGEAGNDTLYGGEDGDQLYGDDGDDTLYGGNSDDTLFGGLGNDTLDGGVGDDILNGGEGGDMFMYAKGTGWDTMYGGEGQGWLDTIHVSGVASGLDANGLGTDWTLQIDHGSIVSADANSLTLSQDTDGSIVFNDGATVAFHNIERIEWS